MSPGDLKPQATNAVAQMLAVRRADTCEHVRRVCPC